jgi:hypothetical protein
MSYDIHSSKLNNAIDQLEYVQKEIQKEERHFEDMDLTLRLHNVIKYLKQEQFVFYKARQKERGGWL